MACSVTMTPLLILSAAMAAFLLPLSISVSGKKALHNFQSGIIKIAFQKLTIGDLVAALSVANSYFLAGEEMEVEASCSNTMCITPKCLWEI